LPADDALPTALRLDKWLWAARFFKTRSAATQAVETGRVKLKGERTKPAKLVHIGDLLEVRAGPYTFQVTVRGLCERRGPASEARRLYEESEASQRERALLAAQLRANAAFGVYYKGRPTKKARRQLSRVVADWKPED
jgi:ribosome-associated heat shock protein Hsp15